MLKKVKIFGKEYKYIGVSSNFFGMYVFEPTCIATPWVAGMYFIITTMLALSGMIFGRDLTINPIVDMSIVILLFFIVMAFIFIDNAFTTVPERDDLDIYAKEADQTHLTE